MFQRSLNIASVRQVIMMHVCTCIVTQVEVISMQVMASGNYSGLGFSYSLAESW
jgi:hypothetical protein